MLAFCWRSGEIGFGEKEPSGAIGFVSGDADAVKDAVSAVARHGRDNKTLLVPGIPEAADDDEALRALIRFSAACARRSAFVVDLHGARRSRGGL